MQKPEYIKEIFCRLAFPVVHQFSRPPSYDLLRWRPPIVATHGGGHPWWRPPMVPPPLRLATFSSSRDLLQQRGPTWTYYCCVVAFPNWCIALEAGLWAGGARALGGNPHSRLAHCKPHLGWTTTPGQEYMQHTGKEQPVVRKLPLGQASNGGDLTFSYRTELNFEFLNFSSFPECALQFMKSWHDLDWAIMAKTPQARSGQWVHGPTAHTNLGPMAGARLEQLMSVSFLTLFCFRCKVSFQMVAGARLDARLEQTLQVRYFTYIFANHRFSIEDSSFFKVRHTGILCVPTGLQASPGHILLYHIRFHCCLGRQAGPRQGMLATPGMLKAYCAPIFPPRAWCQSS